MEQQSDLEQLQGRVDRLEQQMAVMVEQLEQTAENVVSIQDQIDDLIELLKQTAGLIDRD